MHNKLTHLTNEQIEELIKRYYNNEKVSDLILEYELSITPNKLVNYLPPEKLETICKYCDVNFIKPRQARSYKTKNDIREFCPNCGHNHNENCFCINCNPIDFSETELNKQEFLDDVLFYSYDEINMDELSLIDKIYLGALLRAGISENYDFILPTRSYMLPLAPTNDYTAEILERLLNAKAIVIHPNTDPDLIEITDYETGEYKFDMLAVNWKINIKNEEENKINLIESLIKPPNTDKDDFEELFLLWKKIALHESIEYLTHNIYNNFYYVYSAGIKTNLILTELINNFSVSQIYNIIYISIRQALRYEEDNNLYSIRAANTVIGIAKRYGSRAKSNDWNIKSYNRISQCPQSILSEYFFNKVINIGADGFYKTPSIELIK